MPIVATFLKKYLALNNQFEMFSNIQHSQLEWPLTNSDVSVIFLFLKMFHFSYFSSPLKLNLDFFNLVKYFGAQFYHFPEKD